MPIQPVILSGGSGTRLWPLSREAYPKQFLPLLEQYSLLQATLRRLDGLNHEHPRQTWVIRKPLIVCNTAHRFLVAEQLRQLTRSAAAILLEPVGRNTAPALTLAALCAVEVGDDPMLLAMPADQCMGDEVQFRQAVAAAYELAQLGAVITFGIQPDSPETGYGYLHRGAPLNDSAAFQLQGFREKPDQATAQSYLDSGEYAWNSGIFMLRAQLWLRLIATLRPEILDACRHAMTAARQDTDFTHIDAAAFSACPSDSIDYAVMEPLASRADHPSLSDIPALIMPLTAAWSDVGAWPALWALRSKDADGNALEGDVFVHAAHNNLLIAQHRMLAVVGVDGLVVVETPDAVLVTRQDCAQDVKVVTQHLKDQQRDECRQHRRCHRPWGNFEPVDHGPRYQVKRLQVAPGQALSLQMHHHRAEHWIVVSGTARVTRNDEIFLLTENQSTYIPLGARHRLENPGVIPLEIIEVQSGSYLGEDDIVRFEDIYHRGPDAI